MKISRARCGSECLITYVTVKSGQSKMVHAYLPVFWTDNNLILVLPYFHHFVFASAAYGCPISTPVNGEDFVFMSR